MSINEGTDEQVSVNLNNRILLRNKNAQTNDKCPMDKSQSDVAKEYILCDFIYAKLYKMQTNL